MTSPADLAEAIATIFGLQAADIDWLSYTESSTLDDLESSTQTAIRLWRMLPSHSTVDSGLAEHIRTLAASPSEAARQTVQDAIAPIIGTNEALQIELRSIIQHSPYASLIGLPPDSNQHLTDRLATDHTRNRVLGWLLAVTVGFFFLSGLITRLDLSFMIFLLLIARGILYGYFADDLRVKRPIMIGVFAALPGSNLALLLSLAGYRLTHATNAEDKVTYTRLVRILFLIIACIPVVLFVVLLLINPRYVLLLTANAFGLTLAAMLVAAFATLALTTYFAYWKASARTGLGIGLASLLIGLSFPLAMWLTLLGPATVEVREQFGGDIFRMLLEGR